MESTEFGPDVLLVVPFQPMISHGFDPTIRQTLGAHLGTVLTQAVAEFEQFLGHSLDVLQWTDHPMLHGQGASLPARRSLTAVALATHLEKEGLDWAAVDPGPRPLRYWRRCFQRMRRKPPRAVALSTSFVIGGSWLKVFCGLVRRMLPESKLLVGGSFYTTSVPEFLSLDADVFCIGEGEHRLPQVVKAIRDGGPLDGIPGLYLRRPDGSLAFTGAAAPLNLERLVAPDWSLGARIEPPIDPQQDLGYYLVETQRGCGHHCEFCTFRTVTHHEMMSPDSAVDAILRTADLPRGTIFLVDATATSPRKRWEEILQKLIARGGSPHPLVAFARVSDVTDHVAELMSRAGVQGLVIGQESGDQRLLNAMNKGIKVEQVPVAVNAMGKHGLGAQFAFMCGFPGETAESMQATRSMITTLNERFPAEPVVPIYVLIPFSVFDFASVRGRAELQGVHHPLGYESAAFSPQRVAEEMLATMIAASRVPHAPVWSSLFNELVDFLFNVGDRGQRYEIFRWLKAFERGVAIFLERDLDGREPDGAELRRLREQVLAHCRTGGWLRSAVARTMARSRARSSRRVRAEWIAEKEKGPGLITKSYAAFCTYRDLGTLRDARAAWKTGTYPDIGSRPGADPAELEKLSAELIRSASG